MNTKTRTVSTRTTVKIAAVAILVVALTGCFEILELNQPSTARTGQSIEVTMEVRTDGPRRQPTPRDRSDEDSVRLGS